MFKLPGKKQLQNLAFGAEVVVIDATETPIEWPKKGQKRFYSGKKKRHTLKTQLVVDPKTQSVICTTFAAGKEHDFHLFKRSKVKLKKETECLADKGYQGIKKLHPNSQLPKKKLKGKQLSQLDRENNREHPTLADRPIFGRM